MSESSALLDAFGISAEDIAANRNERLGPAQARNLRRSGYWDLAAAFAVGVILAAILYGVANRPLRPAQWITAAVLFLIAFIVGFLHHRRMIAAVADGRVDTLVGVVEVSSRGKQGWFVSVADRTFRMPVRPWHIKSGASYRVYFSPRANRIVAMEPDGVPSD